MRRQDLVVRSRGGITRAYSDTARPVRWASMLVCLLVAGLRPVSAQQYVFVTQWEGYSTTDYRFYPVDIAVGSDGYLYVVDYGNRYIQEFDRNGQLLSLFDGSQWGSHPPGFWFVGGPRGIATDAYGGVYVSEENGFRIDRFDWRPTGSYVGSWGTWGSGDGEFDFLGGVATDGPGNVYVADYGNNRIQKFDSSGHFITKWGSFGTGEGQFDDPQDVATDSAGNVYVVDTGNQRIEKFDPNGQFITKWGSYGSGQFPSPHGIAIDGAGNFYVSDQDDRIQKFDPNGRFITMWGSRGSGDGQFLFPQGLATDDAGNVYVADSGNNRIQKFRPLFPEVTRATPRQHVGALNTVPFTALFNVPMFRASVESNFSIFPAKAGALSWTGKLLTFTPTTPWQPNRWYTVTINKAARSAAGVKMAAAFTWQFKTVAPTGPALLTVAIAPAAAGCEIVTALAAPATVSVTVSNLAGHTVAVLPERDLAAGASTLLWNGRSIAGAMVPAGQYLARVSARAADGSQAQAVATVRLR